MPLRLRRGTVVGEDPLTVEIDGERRPAWADTALLEEMREGDEVVVNVAALELELGSGGFDVVHVNLTRGLGPGPDPADRAAGTGDGSSAEEPHVIKLNYTSIQHPVEPIEAWDSADWRLFRSMDEKGATSSSTSVLVLPLHGHLAPAAWALAAEAEAAAATEGAEAAAETEAAADAGASDGESGGAAAPIVGYVQTGGGALPGSLSRDVAELRGRGLLAGHITAAPAYGGEHEAISVCGALDAGRRLGWDVALVGPGPGIIGSNSEFGHGGMAALDSAHAALSLGLPTMISPRLSSADPRERHVGLSHHTHTVLELLLAPADVAVPEGDLEIAAALEEAAAGRHPLHSAPADLDGYESSGLPVTTMGRSLREDPLFFAAPLAAGAALRRKG